MTVTTFEACVDCGVTCLHTVAGRCFDCDVKDARRRHVAGLRHDAAYRDRHLAKWGVPALYRGLFLDSEVSVAKGSGKWREWAGTPPVVVMSGRPGVGKTYLAVELAVRLDIPGTRFVRGTDAVGAEIDDESPARAALSAPCLILDDFGTGTRGGGWDLLWSVFDRRYARKLPTIITTNLRGVGADDGQKQVEGEALLDRLKDALHIPLVGESKRGKR